MCQFSRNRGVMWSIDFSNIFPLNYSEIDRVYRINWRFSFNFSNEFELEQWVQQAVDLFSFLLLLQIIIIWNCHNATVLFFFFFCLLKLHFVAHIQWNCIVWICDRINTIYKTNIASVDSFVWVYVYCVDLDKNKIIIIIRVTHH